jgi:hypothetical protein
MRVPLQTRSPFVGCGHTAASGIFVFMTSGLITKASGLMREQTADYARLDAVCVRLSEALTAGDSSAVESITRSGETILLQMRARLVSMIQALTSFAEARAKTSTDSSREVLDPEARAEFESASDRLIQSATDFQTVRSLAAILTTSAATFATACIEACGIQPTTYRGPYTRGETRPWA